MKRVRNVRIYAELSGREGGMNIGMDLSGQREFVVYHRYNPQLYAFFRDGVWLEELDRWTYRDLGAVHRGPKGRSKRMQRQQTRTADAVDHIRKVAYSVLQELQEYREEVAARVGIRKISKILNLASEYMTMMTGHLTTLLRKQFITFNNNRTLGGSDLLPLFLTFVGRIRTI